ncbi:hypothetical protein AAFF_G00264380 [Aldrovandia affinis]|uniref:Uncharacterized protein n=1 Tax=Aldrovandia affinis TaxID=143900 RepID=A0AAD7WTA2_9TELE|nr:hypothetical protein AAFF_G00264380 [Aldrovandia affinis]
MQTVGLIQALEQCLNRMQTMGLIRALEQCLNRMQTMGLIQTLEQCLNSMETMEPILTLEAQCSGILQLNIEGLKLNAVHRRWDALGKRPPGTVVDRGKLCGLRGAGEMELRKY